jgi:hypothetical protein
MVRDTYEWNAVFRTGGPGGVAALGLLFRFSGTSGNLTPGSATGLSDLNDSRAGMVRPATGQQMAAFLGVEVLKPDVILAGKSPRMDLS